MEKFYITFRMNNGDKIEIEQERDPSLNFLIALKQSGKWFQSDNQIINLDNVNSVEVESETKRKEELEALNNISF